MAQRLGPNGCVDGRAGLAPLDPLQPLGVEPPRRQRVEHDPSTDRRAGPQHDAVAPRGDDRPLQPELSVPAAAHQPRGNICGPEVDGDRRRNVLELLERHVQPVGDRKGARLDEGVAARDPAALDAGQRNGDPLSGLGAPHRPVVHLDAPHADVEAARLDPQRVALADRPRPQRARDHGSDPVQREDPVDVEPGRPLGSRRSRRLRRRPPARARPAARPAPHPSWR